MKPKIIVDDDLLLGVYIGSRSLERKFRYASQRALLPDSNYFLLATKSVNERGQVIGLKYGDYGLHVVYLSPTERVRVLLPQRGYESIAEAATAYRHRHYQVPSWFNGTAGKPFERIGAVVIQSQFRGRNIVEIL